MSYEIISLLLNWAELGALLAILFRLDHIFELIASTQRELRRAIHRLGEHRAAELGIGEHSGGRVTRFPRPSPPAPGQVEDTNDADLAAQSP